MTVQLTATCFFCAIGLLLLFKALPPNRWLGLRTARTLANPAVWYRTHRALGWLFLVTALVAAVLALWPTTPVHPAWGLVGVLAVAAAFVFVYRRYAA
jgi:uncharacterized membrane protein